MKENKNIFNAFAASGLTDWEHVAREELQGANPWEKLTSPGEGFTIKPYYDNTNTSPSSFRIRASANSPLGPRTWYNCPLVKVQDPGKANETALQHLQQGADGIFFELDEQVDFDLLLDSIQWQICSLNFLAKKNPDAVVAELKDFMRRKKIMPDVAHGAFFGCPTAAIVPNQLFRFGGYRPDTVSSPVDEIVSGILSVYHSLKDEFVHRVGEVAFSLNVGTDFFLEIARLRAFHQVWNMVLEARNAPPQPLFIHARSESWSAVDYSPHSNMLKGTTAAMAAILGGCDVLTVSAEDADQPMVSRVARNVSNILRLESHFSGVADPIAGSYFIEDLTNQLVQSAWKRLQTELI